MPDLIQWELDFQKGLSRGKSEGKLIFLDFFNPQ
jgi:hypothetical protein